MPLAVSRLPVGSSASSSARLAHQRAGDRDPLLLAAGELAGAVLEPVAEADRGQRGRGPLPSLRPAHAAVDQRQPDVVQGAGAAEQLERLEDEADGAVAQLGQLGVGEGRDVAAADPQQPVGRPVQAAEQVHQRRLAGAGRADDRDVLAGVDAQAHPAQRLDRDPVQPVAAPYVDGLDGRDDVGHGTCCPSRTRSAPRTTTCSPTFSPSTTCTRDLPCAPSRTVRSLRVAVLHDPHRVAPPVAEHRGGRHRHGVAGRCAPAGRRPRSCPAAESAPRCRSAVVPRPRDSRTT